MGLTIAYSLFASLIIALTVVPAAASSILKKTQEKPHNLFNKLVNRYEAALRWSLKSKALVIMIVITVFGVSIYLGITMGTSFIPEMESPQMSVTIELPEDSTKEDTYSIADTVIERIVDIDGIETVGAF